MKIMLNSTQVEFVAEVGVELGNNNNNNHHLNPRAGARITLFGV